MALRLFFVLGCVSTVGTYSYSVFLCFVGRLSASGLIISAFVNKYSLCCCVCCIFGPFLLREVILNQLQVLIKINGRAVSTNENQRQGRVNESK